MNNNLQKTLDAREKAREEKVKKAQEFAKKSVDKVEDVKDAIHDKAEAVKASAVHASQQVEHGIHGARETASDIRDDIQHGAGIISRDMRRTVVRISKDLH